MNFISEDPTRYPYTLLAAVTIAYVLITVLYAFLGTWSMLMGNAILRNAYRTEYTSNNHACTIGAIGGSVTLGFGAVAGVIGFTISYLFNMDIGGNPNMGFGNAVGAGAVSGSILIPVQLVVVYLIMWLVEVRVNRRRTWDDYELLPSVFL
ncbi:hypothetical protein BDQ17DRAFT_1409412 [Cyathus striatus]|nr:hypothetical protein BDQ17DRAFT_1409412 [Cyathus striatus]